MNAKRMPKHAAADEPSAESLAEMPEVDFKRAKLVPRRKRPHVGRLEAVRLDLGMTAEQVAEGSPLLAGHVLALEAAIEKGGSVSLPQLEAYAQATGSVLEISMTRGAVRYVLTHVEPRDR